MLKLEMLPAEVKLLNPKPAGCWHCVPAMMHGLLVLCGPTVFPVIGPLSVSGNAEAAGASAKIAAVAPIRIQLFVSIENSPSVCFKLLFKSLSWPHPPHPEAMQRASPGQPKNSNYRARYPN
jgi:hypothetical protein